jgi:phage shock protein PspC (stress-responsive transcriptional regulator)
MEKEVKKKLYRSEKDKMVAGICGGIGEYLGIDSTVVRLLWVIFTVLSIVWPGVLAYAIAWIIMPPHPTRLTS